MAELESDAGGNANLGGSVGFTKNPSAPFSNEVRFDGMWVSIEYVQDNGDGHPDSDKLTVRAHGQASFEVPDTEGRKTRRTVTVFEDGIPNTEGAESLRTFLAGYIKQLDLQGEALRAGFEARALAERNGELKWLPGKNHPLRGPGGESPCRLCSKPETDPLHSEPYFEIGLEVTQ